MIPNYSTAERLNQRIGHQLGLSWVVPMEITDVTTLVREAVSRACHSRANILSTEENKLTLDSRNSIKNVEVVKLHSKSGLNLTFTKTYNFLNFCVEITLQFERNGNHASLTYTDMDIQKNGIEGMQEKVNNELETVFSDMFPEKALGA